MTKRPPARPVAPTEQTHVLRYGLWWPRLQAVPKDALSIGHLNAANIERIVLGNYNYFKAKKSAMLMPWTEHFMRLVSIILDNPRSERRFVWNPNAVRILEQIHTMSESSDKMYLAVAGHASSGKTEFFAVYALFKYWIGATHPDHPDKPASSDNVKVFITSTTLEESRGRVWGVVEKYWREMCRFFGGEMFMQAKLVSSMGKIVRIGKDGKQNQLAGVALISGGKGNDQEASSKIGFKNREVVFIADELPLLTHSLFNTALGNLASNPILQFIGTGNPTSAFDPFGVLMEPEGGWSTVDETYDGWATKRGYCIRFDGEKSPNVVSGREDYPGLLTLKTLLEQRELYGPGYAKNSEYYRQYRGFLAPDGDTNAIYTSTEITSTGSTGRVTKWESMPVGVAFLDPAFSMGGDEACACYCKVGQFYNPVFQRMVTVIELIEVENLMLKVDAKDQNRDRNQQLVDLFDGFCKKRDVAVEDRGVDATGAGNPFSTLMAIKMGRGFQMVSFAGAASDKRVSPTDRRIGTERFANRVSELWYMGKEMVNAGQVRGLDPDTCNQMCARMFKLTDRERVEVEPKRKMKERTNGRSPDRADAFFGCIEIARRRHNLSSAARAAAKAPPKRPTHDPILDRFMNRTRKGSYHDTLPQGLHGGGGPSWGGY